MDPVSFLLSTYLNAFSSAVTSGYSEGINAEEKQISLEYEGYEINYAYQRWKVKNQSVCSSYRNSTIEYSNCTIKAKALFETLCSEMGKEPMPSATYQRARSMYCYSAKNYKPVIASISKSVTKEEDLSVKKKCNLAIIRASEMPNNKTLREKNEACRKEVVPGNN